MDTPPDVSTAGDPIVASVADPEVVASREAVALSLSAEVDSGWWRGNRERILHNIGAGS